MATARKIEDEFLPAHLAREALRASDNKIADAVDWAERWVNDNPEWLQGHQEAIVRTWLQQTIKKCVTSARTSHMGGSRDKGESAGAEVVAFTHGLRAAMLRNSLRMMDTPLWGGARIGDSTPAEVRASAEQFASGGRSMLRKAKWQKAVAEHAEKNGVGPTDKIRDSLSEQTLLKLWEEVCAE